MTYDKYINILHGSRMANADFLRLPKLVQVILLNIGDTSLFTEAGS